MCKNGNANAEHSTGGKCGDETDKRGLKSSLKGEGEANWPKISTGSPGGGTAYKADSTEKISKDMSELKTEEKGTVAGLFARTVVEGILLAINFNQRIVWK